MSITKAAHRQRRCERKLYDWLRAMTPHQLNVEEIMHLIPVEQRECLRNSEFLSSLARTRRSLTKKFVKAQSIVSNP